MHVMQVKSFSEIKLCFGSGDIVLYIIVVSESYNGAKINVIKYALMQSH